MKFLRALSFLIGSLALGVPGFSYAVQQIYFIGSTSLFYGNTCAGTYGVEQQIYASGQLYCFQTFGSSFYSTTEIDTILTGYVSGAGLSTTLSGYATTTALDGFVSSMASYAQLHTLELRVAALEAGGGGSGMVYSPLELLTVQNGIDIGVAVGLCWAFAFAFRKIARAISKTDGNEES